MPILLGLKGIGPETADSIILYAKKSPVFVVDAYTKRVFSRHGFVDKDIEYHKLQNFITQKLPCDVKLFQEFHALLVAVGKNFCSRIPHCSNCPLKNI